MNMEYDNFKKIIESCHINFLIGSGASKPFLGTLGTIEELLTELSSKPESDCKKVVDASIKKYYFDVAIKGNVEIASGTGAKLESTKNNYKTFLDSLNTILLKRSGNLISKQVNLFTTNMDLFIEYTLENLNCAFNDGFSGRLNPIFGTENFHNTIKKTSSHYEYESDVPLFNLFKLHGSVNWKLNNTKIQFDHDLSVLNKIVNIDSETKYLEIEYKEGKEWKSHTVSELLDEKQVIEEGHNKFIEAYNDLIMINPTKEKFETTTRDLTFYELLRMYSNHLEKENSVLFVFGFSFADEHIREITKRVAISNPTLLIIIFAFDKGSKEAIEKELPSRSNIKYIYDEPDEIKYSLDTINKNYFQKLAKELEEGIKTE